MLFFTILIASLLYYIIWIPYRENKKLRIQAEFDRKLKIFKLITVRRYYKSLKKYTYDEIQDKYNIDYIYNMIGKV